METKYYTVTKIEGEYAYILEDNTKNEIFIAMALLPEGVDIGTKLKYEMFSYEIISQWSVVSGRWSDSYIMNNSEKNGFRTISFGKAFLFAKKRLKK